MNIQQIRAKYPQYNDLSDEQLLRGFHKKYYADLSFEDFSKKIGNSQPEMNVSDEQRARIEANKKAYEQKQGEKSLFDFGAGLAGIKLGAEKALNAATLGGYALANDRLGGDFKEREEQFRREAEAAGLGGAATAADVAITLGAGAPISAGIYNLAGRAGLRGLGRTIATGAAEGAVMGATDTENKSLDEAAENAIIGGLAGGAAGAAGDLLLKGGKNIYALLRPNITAGQKVVEGLINDKNIGEKKLTDFLKQARGKQRSLIEVGDEALSDSAKNARMNSEEANLLLTQKIRDIRDNNPDISRGLIDEIFGNRSKWQNTDAIIEATKKAAGPLYDELNKIGDLSRLERATARRYKGEDGEALLKSIRRNMEKTEPGFVMAKTKEGNIDYPHFLKDSQRAEYVSTLPGTYRHPDEIIPGQHNGNYREYLLKQYYNPENGQEVYDMAIKAKDGTLINKFAREGRAGEREFEKARQARASTDGTTSRTGQTEDASIPAGQHSNNIPSLSRFVKENDLVQREIRKIRRNPEFSKEVRQAADTDFRMLDAVKKNIDDAVEVAKRKGENERIRRLELQKKDFLERVDALVPKYKRARQLYEFKGKALSAQKIGEEALDAKITPEQLARKMRDMNGYERQSLATGMKEKILSTIGSRENEGTGFARFLNRNAKDKLRLVLGKKQADRFIDYAESEVKAYRNLNDVLGGSQTAEKQNIRDRTNYIMSIFNNPTGIVGSTLERFAAPAIDARRRTLAEFLTERGAGQLENEYARFLRNQARAEDLGWITPYLGALYAREVQ